jgi:hypothetical protein
MSERVVSVSFSPRACSGDMYFGLPRIVPSIVIDPVSLESFAAHTPLRSVSS